MDDKQEILDRWKEARESLSTWRSEAKEDYEFVASRQWSDEDKAKLSEEDRPALTFNRTEVFVDAVVGNEINSKLRASYLPRGKEPDLPVSEIVNATAKWVRDLSNADQEENDAFRDVAICGLGVVETRMDYEEDPEGMILKERRDPLLYWWDPSSKKQCLEDRRYDFHWERVDKQLAREMWPDAEFASASQAPWIGDDDAGVEDPRRWYEGNDEPGLKDKNKVWIGKYECVKREAYYKVVDPSDGQLKEMDAEKFKKAKSAYKKLTGNDLQFARFTKKVYYRAFLAGEEVLEYTKAPVQSFTRQVMTGKRDRNRNAWYGIVRVMKDPQRWANKWLSQVLHIINSNAKGGVFFESGVFVDQRKAEEQWATASPLIEVNEGAISQGKLRERVPAAYPTGLDRLMMFAFDSLPFVTGINLEALGLADREQAGIVEAQRRRAAFGILAPLFESLRRFRKNDGRVTLEFIREFISDGRMVRVVGDSGQTQYVPLVRDKLTGTYDIVVDESPDSPDFKEKTWEVLTQLLPTMMKIGYPIPPEIWTFSPLPSAVSQKWVQEIQKGPQIPEQVQQQMAQLEDALNKAAQDVQKLKEENLKLKVDATVDLLKIQMRENEGAAKLQLKGNEIQLNAQTQKVQALIDAAVARYKADLDAQAKIIAERINASTQVATTGISSGLKAGVENAKSALQAETAQNVTKVVDEAIKGVLGDKLKSLEDSVRNVEKQMKEKKPTKKRVKKVPGGYEIDDGSGSSMTIIRTPDGLESK